MPTLDGMADRQFCLFIQILEVSAPMAVHTIAHVQVTDLLWYAHSSHITMADRARLGNGNVVLLREKPDMRVVNKLHMIR